MEPTARGATVEVQGTQGLRVTGATSDEVGELARANGATVLELSVHQATLEERYMELTGSSGDHRTAVDERAPALKVN